MAILKQKFVMLCLLTFSNLDLNSRAGDRLNKATARVVRLAVVGGGLLMVGAGLEMEGSD